ncbi:MAG: AraC family transcriptional regulator, partial [Bacteroidota bacterium]
MKVRLHSSELEELFIENSYPDRFYSSQNGGVTERIISAKLLGGTGNYREIFMENIHIGYGDIQMSSRLEIDFESDFETVEMHFALKGRTRAEEKKTRKSFHFDRNQHNIIYVCGFKGRSFYPPAEGVKLFEVNLLPSFFKRF